MKLQHALSALLLCALCACSKEKPQPQTAGQGLTVDDSFWQTRSKESPYENLLLAVKAQQTASYLDSLKAKREPTKVQDNPNDGTLPEQFKFSALSNNTAEAERDTVYNIDGQYYFISRKFARYLDSLKAKMKGFICHHD